MLNPPPACLTFFLIRLRVWPVTREMLLKAPHVRGIARNGVGYDSIDKPTALEKGICVMNVPGTVSRSSFLLFPIHLTYILLT